MTDILKALGARQIAEDCSSDFGGRRGEAPLMVVKADCEAELVDTLRYCSTREIPVAVRGGGSSCSGRASCPGGVVIVNRSVEPDWKQLDAFRVEVSARTRWLDLERGLNELSLTAPVLTSNLHATVGGTLSAGGFGFRSLTQGAQTDAVLRVRLILPSGEALWCSPEHEAELFRFSLGGLGQVGVIERVEMRVDRFLPFVRTRVRQHASFTDLVQAAPWADPGLELFFARSQGQGLVSVGGVGTEEAGAVPRSVMIPLDAGPPSSAGRRHVWCDYGLSGAALVPFMEFLDAELARGRAQHLSMSYVLALASCSGLSGAFDIRPPGGDRSFGVGLFYTVDALDTEGIAAAEEHQRVWLEECLPLGGRPYLWGAHALTAAVLHTAFGPDYERLMELRGQLDPGNLLNRHALFPQEFGGHLRTASDA